MGFQAPLNEVSKIGGGPTSAGLRVSQNQDIRRSIRTLGSCFGTRRRQSSNRQNEAKHEVPPIRKSAVRLGKAQRGFALDQLNKNH
jgi:hypothetical protein